LYRSIIWNRRNRIPWFD